MAILVSDDIISQLEDGGFDTTVISLSYGQYADNELLTKVSEAVGGGTFSMDMLSQYIADRHHVGGLSKELHLTDVPTIVPIVRHYAPYPVSANDTTIWFDNPPSGLKRIRWYVNGALKIEREQDLASDRSASLLELGVVGGDVIQVCIVEDGIVGWWGRHQLT